MWSPNERIIVLSVQERRENPNLTFSTTTQLHKSAKNYILPLAFPWSETACCSLLPVSDPDFSIILLNKQTKST